MTEQAGEAMSAVDTLRAALSARSRTVGDADRTLAGVVTSAHAVTVAALRRLEEIEAEVEALVENQDALALDTSAGARELQRTMIARQREIVAIVEHAAAEGAAKSAVLQELLARYLPSAEESTN